MTKEKTDMLTSEQHEMMVGIFMRYPSPDEAMKAIDDKLPGSSDDEIRSAVTEAAGLLDRTASDG